MASIMTLDGVPSKPKRKRSLGAPARMGDCKPVHNPRTKKTIQLCYVGKRWKDKNVPTGWRLMSAADLVELKALTPR